MRVCITGGTGFIGSHIARLLDREGYTLRVLHRASSDLRALDGVRYESVVGDVLDVESLHTAFAGCEWVFHAAAVADYWRADRDRLWRVNVEGTQHVLEAARACGVGRVIFTSSGAAIGRRPGRELSNEDDAFKLPPDAFPYASSKWAAEERLRAAVADGQDAVILNPGVVVGPGDLNAISGTFLLEVQRLQWLVPISPGGLGAIDVRDVAVGHLAAARNGQAGQRYILSAENLTYREWYRRIAAALEVAAPRVGVPRRAIPVIAPAITTAKRLGLPIPADATQVRMSAHYQWYDNRKMREQLGPPTISLDQSLRDAAAWYRDHDLLPQTPRLIASIGRWFA